MDNKHKKARMEMLKKMSSSKRDSLHEGLGKALADKKGKKMQEVTVASDSKEGLEKGLSLAQKLMQARFGEKLEKGEAPSKEDIAESLEGSSEEEEAECPICKGEGCQLCEEESEEQSEGEEA